MVRKFSTHASLKFLFWFAMRTKKIMSILFILFITGSGTILSSQPAKVTTDKDDYIPGEWVIITGTGWQGDDSVQLILTHLYPLPEPYHSHIPWFVYPDADGKINYRWFVLAQESGTSFELTARGFAGGITSDHNAVTYFKDAAITSVTVNGSPFCAGQSVTVSYVVSNTGGQFSNNNVFTAQLSDSLGSFSAPVNIGSVNSRRSGNISSVIPPGTPEGAHYRIRVSSSNPVLSSNPDVSDIVIHTQPAAPSPVTATPDAICSGSSSNLNATASTNTIRWYTAATGGSILGTSASGANFTVTPAVTTAYYAGSVNASGCSSSARTMVTVTVTPDPTITSTTPGRVCGSGQVTLGAASSAGTISWYSAATGGQVLATGINFTTPVINATTTYYVDATSNGCTTGARSSVIATVSPIPSAPVVGNITQPTCARPTGSVRLTGLPASGIWTLTLIPGGTVTTGTGTSTTITGLTQGTYTYTVTNAAGCSSAPSSNIRINAVTGLPGAPVVGNITQPTCALATGSVLLSGLPGTGTWTLTRTPGGIITTGTGTTTTISGLVQGSYTFSVTAAAGCSSAPSTAVTINPQPPLPGVPVYSLDCSLGFGHAILTVTSPIGTNLSYSLNAGPYQTSPVFAGVANGNYFLTVRNIEGCTTPGAIFAVLCGCINPPAVAIGAISGITCGRNPVTVTGNTFSGNTTAVTITEDGAGSVNPASSGTTPFSFTYTPAAADAGRTVVITVTSNNPLGPPCTVASGTYRLTVNAIPSAPVIGTVTSLTCSGGLGSIVLNGLPADGTWTLTRSPDNISNTGTGTTTTVSELQAGTYTFAVTSQAGCISSASSNAVIYPQPPSPQPPAIGTITHPTCAVSTGSVVLDGLPSSGSWTLTQFPGGTTRSGTGSTATISLLVGGTFTFTVTNSLGCTSGQSENAVIHEQPSTPTPPVASSIIRPTCTVATGSVNLTGLPSSGSWILTRYPGTIATTGTGTSISISDLATGTFNFTVANAAGCVSLPSADVMIPAQPPSPDIPIIGTITQPTLTMQTGSVTLNRLPSAGTWTITCLPDGTKATGTGTSYTITGLKDGKYQFTVTNSSGCTSPATAEVIIATPVSPVLDITNPEPVCSPATVDITSPQITAGSPAGLIYTYWKDSEAAIPFTTPDMAENGTYYIKGTASSGFYDIEPVTVTVEQIPVSNPGPDQLLQYEFTTTLNAVLDANETGLWRADSGNAVFTSVNDPYATVSDLAEGKNVLVWIVSNGICPSDTGKLRITVKGVTVPTLITPNGDSKNEYLIINGLENLGKTDLIIFDRRGKELFRNTDYDNKWNGVDYDGNPLSDDTYFYVLKAANGNSLSGFIMIRR